MEHAVTDRPAATSPARLAADIVAVVREGSGIRLDYTLGSLASVDRVIGNIRREQPPIEAVLPALQGFGAYAGQVLVLATSATWVVFDADQRDTFGQAFGLRTPDGQVWNPLGRAVQRYENGPQDSLRAFCLTVAESARS
ncbi:hypothetical protein [Actinacidiphila acidipaludis]|uniref:Uncharacterized protein n=1 Tax=Actinacidiphila acidipaludis TaxID=2873382 RepID=A0ABS7Q3N4_9ACTN|nr:hypothetical protein [Streptomyces acidipaludis]MBY8877563.1 hypothetical protein [Streptomyces acidipaludis]